MLIVNPIADVHISLYTLLAFNCIPFIVLYLRDIKDAVFPILAILLLLTVGVLYKLPEVYAYNALLIVGVCHIMLLASSAWIVLSTSSQYNNLSTKQAAEFGLLNLNRVDSLGWSDVIVDARVKNELQLIIKILKEPTIATRYGIDVPKGLLLSGPPGNGKTTLAKVVAHTASVPFFLLSIPEIVSKWVGDSEKNLSQLFASAQRHAPAIIFIDELDAIGRARTGDAQVSERLLNHMLQLIDGIIGHRGIYLIAATNHIALIDPALKRPGRLNKIIEVPHPDKNLRIDLFKLYLSKLNLEPKVQIDKLAEHTVGFSGADIKEICNQAGMNAFAREQAHNDKQKNYQVTSNDLVKAINDVIASKQTDS